MKQKSTLFLKIAIVVIGIPVLALSLIGVYLLIQNPANPKYAYVLYPIVFGIYSSTIPFYVALFNAFKLLNYIDQGIAFSEQSEKALKHIKYCASVFCGIYVALLPILFLLAEKDDAPGLILMGMVPIFASFILAVFAAVQQRIFKEAIEIKSEQALVI
jgi:hypothetical protein